MFLLMQNFYLFYSLSKSYLNSFSFHLTSKATTSAVSTALVGVGCDLPYCSILIVNGGVAPC